jgi:hypothetical protein
MNGYCSRKMAQEGCSRSFLLAGSAIGCSIQGFPALQGMDSNYPRDYGITRKPGSFEKANLAGLGDAKTSWWLSPVS